MRSSARLVLRASMVSSTLLASASAFAQNVPPPPPPPAAPMPAQQYAAPQPQYAPQPPAPQQYAPPPQQYAPPPQPQYAAPPPPQPAPMPVAGAGGAPGGANAAPIDNAYPYTVESSAGPVTIERQMPTEVGRWGWTWFGDHNWNPSPGTGAQDTTISMVGLRHWVTPKWGWEGALGIVVDSPAGSGFTYTSFGLQGGLLYSLARYEYLNIFAAGRALLVPYGHPDGNTTIVQFGLQGQVAAELFLDGLQLFHTGPMVRTSRAISVTVGFGLGFDFTFYSANGGSTSQAKFATTGASSIANGQTSGTIALTYYFGGP